MVYVLTSLFILFDSIGPPVFLLVVDTCLEDAELEHLKDSLQQVRPSSLSSSIPPSLPSYQLTIPPSLPPFLQ